MWPVQGIWFVLTPSGQDRPSPESFHHVYTSIKKFPQMTKAHAGLSREPWGFIQCWCSSASSFEGNKIGISQRQQILKLDLFITPAQKVSGTEDTAPLQTLTSSTDHNGPNIPARHLLARFLESLWARLTQEASSKFPCPEISLFAWFLASAHLAHIKQMVP